MNFVNSKKKRFFRILRRRSKYITSLSLKPMLNCIWVLRLPLNGFPRRVADRVNVSLKSAVKSHVIRFFFFFVVVFFFFFFSSQLTNQGRQTKFLLTTDCFFSFSFLFFFFFLFFYCSTTERNMSHWQSFNFNKTNLSKVNFCSL